MFIFLLSALTDDSEHKDEQERDEHDVADGLHRDDHTLHNLFQAWIKDKKVKKRNVREQWERKAID